MPQGVVFLNQAGRVIDANSAAERILGLAGEQLKQREPFKLFKKTVHEDGTDFPEVDQPAQISLATGQEMHDVIMGVQPLAKDVTIWLRVNSVPQFFPGETQAHQVYMTLEDITASKTVS